MTRSADAEVLYSKTNTELLCEVDELIENSTAETMDVEAIKMRLQILQERASVEPLYSEEESFELLMEEAERHQNNTLEKEKNDQ